MVEKKEREKRGRGEHLAAAKWFWGRRIDEKLELLIHGAKASFTAIGGA